MFQTQQPLFKQPLLLFFSMLLLCTASAQQHRFTGWWTTNFGVRVHAKWSLNFDSQLNTGDQFNKIETLLLRPAVFFRFNKKYSASAGYVFFDNRKTVQGISELIPEHRFWQQVQLNTSSPRHNWVHRLRMEQRWIPNVTVENNNLEKRGTNLNNRIRYFTRVVGRLSKPSGQQDPLYWAMQNEVFVNLTGSAFANKKVLDQVRPSIGLGAHLTKVLDMELGYMLIYVPLPDQAYRINNVARISTTVLL